MSLTFENLIVVTRPSMIQDSKEVLVGRKKRGRFSGYDVFPGGKVEGSMPQEVEARRELHEETGVNVSPELLKQVGKLIIQDMREESKRFGSIVIFLAEVEREVKAHETDELAPRWVSLEDSTLTEQMPPDAQSWWPYVRDFNGEQTLTHIYYGPNGALSVITKKPDFAHMPGEILHSMTS